MLNFRGWSRPRNYFNSEIFPIYGINFQHCFFFQHPVFLLALLHAVLELDVWWGTAPVTRDALSLVTAAVTLLRCHASQVHK